MTSKQNPVDRRPFRSKAEHLLEKHLEAQYRGLAIPEIVAVLATRQNPADRTRATAFASAG